MIHRQRANEKIKWDGDMDFDNRDKRRDFDGDETEGLMKERSREILFNDWGLFDLSPCLV